MNDTIQSKHKFLRIEEIMLAFKKEMEGVLGVEVEVEYKIKKREAALDKLAKIVCFTCNVQWNDIISPRRTHDLMIARQIFCWFAKVILKNGYVRIGRFVHRDHATVMYSRKVIDRMIVTNDDMYMKPLREINDMLGNIPSSETEKTLIK